MLKAATFATRVGAARFAPVWSTVTHSSSSGSKRETTDYPFRDFSVSRCLRKRFLAVAMLMMNAINPMHPSMP